MDIIFHQLGELVLGSVPTIVLFILLIVAYNALVRRPLEKVLADRRARTTGAVEQAREALSAVEAETAVYEDKLRGAKAELSAVREARLKRWAGEREKILNEVRGSIVERVTGARRDLEASADVARMQIEATSDELSSKIIRAVLPAGVALPEAGQ